MALKTTLTTDEIFRAAYLHHVMGVEQHVLSVAFSVNVGRISEACAAMQYAAENVRSIYHMARPKEPADGLHVVATELEQAFAVPRVLQGGPLQRDR